MLPNLDLIAPMLSVAGAISLGAMSPGPSFLFVVQTVLSKSRIDGVAAALGMAFGSVLFAGAALLGLIAVLDAVPWLYVGGKILGGAYLIFLAFLVWRDARKPLFVSRPAPGTHARTLRMSFCRGLLMQLSNPKTAVVYASIFVSLLPGEFSFSSMLVLLAMIFVIEAGWYTLVALVFSAPSPRAVYWRSKFWIDRVTATVLGLLGTKLIIESGTHN